MTDDQLFALVSMLCVLLWLASNAAPLGPDLRRKVRLGAWLVLGFGLALALFRLVQYLLAG